jgi:hypothetical protein
MFVDVLVSGRNTTKLLEEFLTPEEIIRINKKLQLYKKKMNWKSKNDF